MNTTRILPATLMWNYEKHAIAGKTLISASFRINSDGTATFQEKSDLANGLFNGSGYTVTGILVRQ